MGPLLIGIIAAVAGGLHGGSSSALIVILFLTVLRIVQDYFIYPRLIGQGSSSSSGRDHRDLAGAELAGIAGIFLAIPVVAILTVSYRHWLEHRGSEGLADLLEPTSEPDPAATAAADAALLSRLGYDVGEVPSAKSSSHPTKDSTPADMARERPDLTTEVKMPVSKLCALYFVLST